jgi:hypothetical protein
MKALLVIVLMFLSTGAIAGGSTFPALAGKQLGASSPLSPSAASPDSVPDFTYDLGSGMLLNFDFDEKGLLHVYLTGGSSFSFGSGITVTFSDINHEINDIVSFNLGTVGSGITGLIQGDLSFTTDSARIDFGSTHWVDGTEAKFKINFAEPAPAPGTLALALLGLAAGGFFWGRRKT